MARRLPRPPDWVIYSAAASLILLFAMVRQERADAPEAPPPVPGAAIAPLSDDLPFNPSRIVKLQRHVETRSGTAFSVSEAGVWLTAAHVLKGCRKVAVVVAEGRGVAAEAFADPASDVAVLKTQGGAPALPLAASAPAGGSRGFQPGYPQGRAGETAARLLGPGRLPASGRGEHPHPVLAWTEVGRTDGLMGMLDGLSGAPVLDEAGQVVGLTLAEAPRRGRLYTTSTEALHRAVRAANAQPASFARGEPVNVDNYGRVADAMRRDLRIARVACLED